MPNFIENLHWAYNLKKRENKFTLDRRFLFIARALYFPIASNAWFGFLRSGYLASHPKTLSEVVEQVHRPYYDLHLKPHDKAALLIGHFNKMLHTFGASISKKLVAKEQIVVSQFLGKSGRLYQITLSQNEKFNREGNLTFSLISDGEILIRTAFTIKCNGQDSHILIGCIQATPNDTVARLREATHDLYGIQPRILLINLVRKLCQHYGFTSIEAISSKNHIFQIKRYRHKFIIHMVYDELWQIVGGVLKDNGNFDIPIEIPNKPIESYPSNKRSEHKHRNQLMAQIDINLKEFFSSNLDS